MNLNFDFQTIRAIEFGIGRDDGDGQTFWFVPADDQVQVALREMATGTWEKMQELATDPPRYEPSEKYGSVEYSYLPVDDPLAERMLYLHTANNLPTDGNALEEASKVFCYFGRMVDGQGRHLTALRRATQFKGVLKKRLLRLFTDTLQMMEEKVFIMDADFDMLIDSTNLHILRASGFEFVGKLQDAILAAVPHNVNVIQLDLEFVDFTCIESYASKHPRAARYLGSIRTQLKDIDKEALREQCEATGVKIEESNGKITVQEDDVMGFLEVLDRRRYGVELVKDTRERYRALSRHKLTD